MRSGFFHWLTVLLLGMFILACADDSSENNYSDTVMENYCGNGIVEGEEFCDDGLINGDHWLEYKRCNATCTGYAPFCGDGIVDDTNEMCDDNHVNNPSYSLENHCKLDCTGFYPYCGNGIVEEEYGESCDNDGEDCNNCVQGSAVYVEDFGAIGDGVHDDSESIEAALRSADVVLLTPGKQYSICSEILGGYGKTLIGYGAAIKRCDMRSAILIEQAEEGGSEVLVDDASLFTEGMGVSIAFEEAIGAYGDNVHLRLIDKHVEIVDIEDNRIILSLALRQDYPPGSVLLTSFQMLIAPIPFKVIGVTFDGNRQNNNAIISWTSNGGIGINDGGVW